MNDSRYRWILYSIVLVILSTITIQVYWNYKNYQINKQQLINDVQVSLDNAIDRYYATLAKRRTIGFAFSENSQEGFFDEDGKFDSILNRIDRFKELDSIDVNSISGVAVYRGLETDSLLDDFHLKHKTDFHDSIQTNSEWLTIERLDSLSEDNFKVLTSKIVISLTNDTLSLKKIDTLLKNELNRKNLTIKYGLSFIDDSEKKEQALNANFINSSSLSTSSKSTFLPNNSTLKVYFNNETKIILKRILTGILISTLLVLAVISCLFYLLRIIKQQKQLAEIKNDLISNITHEFKTPIATIGVALESIKNFNVIDDKEKTKKYLDMSSEQLIKLNTMVEKLLETASLDSDNLELIKEECNTTELLNSIINKHQMQVDDKTINLSTTSENILAKVDIFHFDNAVNNLIDNAIKYGGNSIVVNLEQNSFSFTVSVSDNGNSLTKANKDKIFEKFYRVQKGNTHNVKGFGIGLYYVKKIVEKHGGAIHLDLKYNQTTFKMTFPNE